MSPFVAEPLLVVASFSPLACAACMAPSRTRKVALALVPWAALPALVVAVSVPVGTSVRFDAVLLGLHLGLDGIGQVFLAFTSLVWWLSGLYARAYLDGGERQGSFWLFFCLALAGNVGLIVAQDLVGFYAGFALMSLASYALVVHGRTGAALRAGRIYMGFAIAGELAVFAGLVGLAAGATSPRFDAIAGAAAPRWALACAAAGFGVKVGALGLHLWLPLAHPAAPVPASAVLSGSMIKAGLLGWLRIMPLGSAGLEHWGWALLGAGIAAAFYGAAIGVTQRDPKAVLAYSSVSQMGLMTSGLGFGLAMPVWGDAALIAVLLYAIHHALAKSALFLGVGVAGRATGLSPRLVTLILAMPALSLAGAPLTSGALAKSLLKSPIAEAGEAGTSLVLLLSAAAVGTTLLMLRFLAVLPRGAAVDSGRDPRLLPPWLALLAMGPVLALAPWPAVGKTSLDLLTAPKLALALVPVVAGVVAAALARPLMRRWPRLRREVPPGDLLVLLARAVEATPRLERNRERELDRLGVAAPIANFADRVESFLGASPVAGALWLGLVLLFFIAIS